MVDKIKFEEDANWLIDEVINTHPDKEELYEWYTVGPGEFGFMWCDYNLKCKQDIRNAVLSKGYDSSGYGCFQRYVQTLIRDRQAVIPES